jgi:hypothetical protein
MMRFFNSLDLQTHDFEQKLKANFMKRLSGSIKLVEMLSLKLSETGARQGARGDQQQDHLLRNSGLDFQRLITGLSRKALLSRIPQPRSFRWMVR